MYYAAAAIVILLFIFYRQLVNIVYWFGCCGVYFQACSKIGREKARMAARPWPIKYIPTVEYIKAKATKAIALIGFSKKTYRKYPNAWGP